MTIKPTTIKDINIKTALGIVLGIGFFSLIFFNMRDRIFGVPLKVITAKNGATLSSPFLSITGRSEHARSLTINGRSITVDRKGTFNEEIVLSPGYNIIEISAIDQFGNKKVKTYQVVFSSPHSVAAAQ